MQIRRAESARDMLDIFAIRRAVFNGEQGISLDREIDDTDFASGTIHFLGEDASGAPFDSPRLTSGFPQIFPPCSQG